MPDSTAELNLALARDDDDTADYLDLDAGPSLRASLRVIDGLFNVTTGHTHNGAHQGGPITTIPAGAIPDGSVTTSKLAANSVATGNIQDGAVTAAKLAAAIIEAIYTGTVATPSTNYTVVSPVMFVFCQAAFQVVLPAAASTNRPITIWALSGAVAVIAASGGVFGGSINLSTGAVTNGSIITADAITYKSDGTNWRAG